MRNTPLALLFYLLLFGLLFWGTLNFNYVEGDDAATILYHLCGRNPQIQQPYAAYHSGMDWLLQLSGLQTEEALRTFAVSVSFVSGFLVLALLAWLLESLFGDNATVSSKNRLYFYLLLPFLLPDFIFHSLIVNASNIGFVFLLASLLVFVRFLKRQHYLYLALSVVLFALSVPFRWTMLMALPLYAGLFLYFHPLRNYPKEVWLLAGKIALANTAGVVLAIICIGISGYDLEGIRQTVASGTGYLEKSEVSVLSMLASASAFLTPALLLLLVFALVKIWSLHRSGKSISMGIFGWVVLSASPFLLFGFYPMYKYSMTFVPALLALALLGFDYLMHRKIAKILLLCAVFFPWVIGLQVEATGTFCGPGFEMQTNPIQPTISASQNPDSRIKIQKISPVLDSGFYLPMAEGPRPLYGYGYVLFGGQWKKQIDIFTQEREQLFDFLSRHPEAVYFQEGKFYFLCDLYRHGFRTKMGSQEGLFGSYRIFRKGEKMLVVNDMGAQNKVQSIADCMESSATQVVFRSSYSNDILKLAQTTPVQLIGPFTAISQE